MYHSGVSPFGGYATTFPPQAGAQQPVLTVEPLMKRVFRGVLFCPRLRGQSGTAGKGGEHSEPVTRMPSKPYDTESKSRNADFKNCGEAATTTLSPLGLSPPER